MIYYTISLTPIGQMILAVQNDKIVGLAFGEESQVAQILTNLFKNEETTRNDKELIPYVQKVLNHQITTNDIIQEGTPFQKAVWEKLCQIPKGTTLSYSDLAYQIGRPQAVRAVANAVARNNISLLIPCHRVIAKGGKLGGYRWGISFKRKLLEIEAKSVSNLSSVCF